MDTKTPLLTGDQVKLLIGEAVTAAVKAVNTVNPEDRPAATKEVPAVHIRARTPRFGRALKALYKQSWAGAEMERDISLATKDLFKLGDAAPDSLTWFKSPSEAMDVYEHMGEKDATKHRDAIDNAIKAMSESGSYALTGGTSGGILVPPEFLQAQFAYALSPNVALRRVAGVRVMPVTSNNIRLPRESTRAGASQAAEAGTLTAADAVLSQQSINIEKQYAYRLFSNELMDDADPSFMEFLANTVLRDLSIQQDIQYLRGNGSTPQIQGLIGYSGITTGPDLGSNGRSPTFDDVLDALYNLEAVDSKPDFFISHPRFVHTLRKLKDAEGRYLISQTGVPVNAGGGSPDAMIVDGAYPVYKTSNLSIALTVGSSTNTETVILGDSSQVLILERKGVEMAVSRDIAFNTDQTAVRAIGRSAVAILIPAAVETITGVRP